MQKKRNVVSSRCQKGVATRFIAARQQATMFYIKTLSMLPRQLSRAPSSGFLMHKEVCISTPALAREDKEIITLTSLSGINNLTKRILSNKCALSKPRKTTEDYKKSTKHDFFRSNIMMKNVRPMGLKLVNDLF